MEDAHVGGPEMECWDGYFTSHLHATNDALVSGAIRKVCSLIEDMVYALHSPTLASHWGRSGCFEMHSAPQVHQDALLAGKGEPHTTADKVVMVWWAAPRK